MGKFLQNENFRRLKRVEIAFFKEKLMKKRKKLGSVKKNTYLCTAQMRWRDSSAG
jgi:hypothetical protein